ncbi:hypothetical protein BSL78_16983 [Apostichopus japonicus]|uniref:Uncharacterized protein n=1 Tax=Stichopus japonicus TaxID=307972 RepID=A0A2G8KDV0_STIJA|nr:hypothetical protein BSL78_16983 [Apostichopus japonicus]
MVWRMGIYTFARAPMTQASTQTARVIRALALLRCNATNTQDEETRLQWPSPTKRSSQSPPPTVSPLTEGYDEAGCKPTHDETEVIWVLDSDEEAELETPSVNARQPDVVAPKCLGTSRGETPDVNQRGCLKKASS